ncbi:MAG TPA: hypothetical protein DDW52_26090, partial [Planctomycetaceae bacterium]|nr:hypothetical protein [Planctomycetaceae bacterium]
TSGSIGTFVSKIDAAGSLELSSWFQPSQGRTNAASAQITLDGQRPVITGFDSGGDPKTSFFFRFDSDIARIVDSVTIDDAFAGDGLPWLVGSNIVDGSLFVAGYTNNAAFETTSDAIHPVKNAGLDGFVQKYSLGTPPPPPVEINARDSFDNGTPNGGSGPWTGPWGLGSNTGFTSSSSPNDGSTHAIIQRRGSLTRQVDTTGITDLNLSFASKLRSFENSDRAYVRVSPDGSNWTTLKTFVNGEDDNTYRDYSFDIPFESNTLWIRFEGDMSSSRYDYWYVDSVAVTGSIASQPPVATDDSSTADEDQTVTINVLANDSDPAGDTLSIASVTQPSSGSAVIVGSQVEYTPDANFNGSDSFTYTINDTAGNAATATVNLTVTPVNDAPVSVDDSVTTPEDTPVTVDVLGNDSDVDGDILSVQSATDGSSGLVSVNSDNTLTYTPN